jgi:hypothetical protein
MNDIRALGVNDDSDQPALIRPASAAQTATDAVAKLRRTPRVNGVRIELVQAIRARIAAGDYDSIDKLNAAVDAMIAKTAKIDDNT